MAYNAMIGLFHILARVEDETRIEAHKKTTKQQQVVSFCHREEKTSEEEE
jgi:hypothetical protein